MRLFMFSDDHDGAGRHSFKVTEGHEIKFATSLTDGELIHIFCEMSPRVRAAIERRMREKVR